MERSTATSLASLFTHLCSCSAGLWDRKSLGGVPNALWGWLGLWAHIGVARYSGQRHCGKRKNFQPQWIPGLAPSKGLFLLPVFPAPRESAEDPSLVTQ